METFDVAHPCGGISPSTSSECPAFADTAREAASSPRLGQHCGALVVRVHPLSTQVPYGLDLSSMGLHCHLPRLTGAIPSFHALIAFCARLEQLTSLTAVRREQEVLRIAWMNGTVVGSVYDLPTVAGWGVFQKATRTDLLLASLFGSTSCVQMQSRHLVEFDDIRPDHETCPEVSFYTEMASMLYEALDGLLLSMERDDDLHLRNLYPHSVWRSGIAFSEGQPRRLAAVAPPPCVYSRWLECPVKGEILAAPGVVKSDGWITFFHALVDSHITGGVTFGTGRLRRFVPRSHISQHSTPASLIMEDLTFAELYYLLRIEELGCNGEMETVYFLRHTFDDTSLGLVDEFLDKEAFCQSREVRVDSDSHSEDLAFEAMARRSRLDNRFLACAEQKMADASSNCDEDDCIEDPCEFEFVYKRDVRVDVAMLDGYDGWSDCELIEKKEKCWSKYTPRILLPVEVAAIYLHFGVRFYVSGGCLRILRADTSPLSSAIDDENVLRDGVTWTTMRSKLETVLNPAPHAADRLLLSLMSSGDVKLIGYYHCADVRHLRHESRRLCVFMDAPLMVLGFLISADEAASFTSTGSCLVVPVGPACTIVMRSLTEKYSTAHGRVLHSDDVVQFHHGCRLGERGQLRWYSVGAGPWTRVSEAPTPLVRIVEAKLGKLACKVSSKSSEIVLTGDKGLESQRLKNIAFEAGWTGNGPHVLVTGKGKRVTTSLHFMSFTQLVDGLRRVRDNKKADLSITIQELAAMILWKEVFVGALNLDGRPGKFLWTPPWKVRDDGFVVGHEIRLLSGSAVREIGTSGDTFGVLLTHDTMVVLHDPVLVNRVAWNFTFMHLDATIESEKLLVGPAFEGFTCVLSAGTLHVTR